MTSRLCEPSRAPSSIDRQSFVAQIARRALEGVDPRAMFEDVCGELATLLGVDLVDILERDGDELRLVAGHGWSAELVAATRVPVDASSLPGYTLATDAPVIVGDALQDRRFFPSELQLAHRVVSGISVPIHAGPRVFGVLGVYARVPHAFSAEDTHLLVAVANILGAAIAHAETRAALDDSRALLETVFEGSSDLIVIVDPEARVRAVSPSVQRIVGHTPDSLIGQPALDHVHPADHGRALDTLAHALDDRAEPLTAELRVRHADGSWRTFEAVGRAVGLPPALLIVINARDVTERRLVEQRLLQAQKLEAVARVTASVAHDLNNVLQAIGMTAAYEPQPGQEIATMVQQGARLLRALLMFARERRTEPARLDARVVIEPLLPMLRRLVGRDIVVRYVASERPVWIYADPLEIEQIVINLVVNARDAMTNTGEITIVTDIRDGAGVIEVTDQGCGIDDATRARMFEPFFTTKDPDRGSGLGLATVQSIVTRRHGRIDVASTVGVGTVFTITLPDGAPP